jgi:UDP-N-acetylmuramoylalanine--D-glutamate ligase
MISLENKLAMDKFADKPCVTTITTTCNDTADIFVCEAALRDKSSQRLVLDLAGITNLRGWHNYQNIAFAYAVCKRIGLSSREISHGIQSFKPLSHRLNIVRKIRNTIFVNDSKATNPPSAARALETFVGYKIYWLIGGRSKKINPIPFVYNHLAAVQKIYLFGESSQEFEEYFKTIKPIARYETLALALKSAFIEANKEIGLTVVLLSPMCASFDQYTSYEHRGNEFVELVNSLGG